MLNLNYYFLLFLSLAIIFSIRPQKAFLALALFGICTLVFSYSYPPRFRGMINIQLATMTIILLFISSNLEKVKNKKILSFMLITISSLVFYFNSRYSYSLKPYRVYAENQLNYLKKNNKLTHVIIGSALSFEGLHPLKQYWGTNQNIPGFIITSQLGGSPHQQKAIKKYGADDFYDLLLHNNVRLITRNKEIPLLIQKYFKEHRRIEVESLEIKQNYGFYCWAFKQKNYHQRNGE